MRAGISYGILHIRGRSRFDKIPRRAADLESRQGRQRHPFLNSHLPASIYLAGLGPGHTEKQDTVKRIYGIKVGNFLLL